MLTFVSIAFGLDFVDAVDTVCFGLCAVDPQMFVVPRIQANYTSSCVQFSNRRIDNF